MVRHQQFISEQWPKMINTKMYYGVALSAESHPLSDLSSLTKVQVETLRIQRMVRESQINMASALKIRKKAGITRGSHYRILGQARKNVKESLFTVATAVQMGMVKPDDVQRLISLASSVPEESDSARLAEAIELIKLVADRIVMF